MFGGQPAFADVTFRLEKGQSVSAGAGCMAYMRGAVDLDSAAVEGGLANAAGRAMANESFVINTFRGLDAGGSVCFAGDVPGDILEIAVQPGETWTLTRGAALCWDPWVSISSKFSARGIIPIGTDEGFVLPTASVAPAAPDGGPAKAGRVWLSAFGRFEKHVLKDKDDTLLVDNGIMLATTLQWETGRAAKTGLFKSWWSGEGFGMLYTGPGVVYTQNRNFGQFRAIVAPLQPTVAQGVAGGVLSAIFGNASASEQAGGARVPKAKKPKAKPKAKSRGS